MKRVVATSVENNTHTVYRCTNTHTVYRCTNTHTHTHNAHVHTHKHTPLQRVQLVLFLYTCILSSSFMMSLMLGRSADLSLVQLLMRDTMAGHWIRWIWSFLRLGWDSGSFRRHISTTNTPKLKTSIFGECSSGYRASGAAYAGLPGPAVVTSFMKLADP